MRKKLIGFIGLALLAGAVALNIFMVNSNEPGDGIEETVRRPEEERVEPFREHRIGTEPDKGKENPADRDDEESAEDLLQGGGGQHQIGKH